MKGQKGKRERGREAPQGIFIRVLSIPKLGQTRHAQIELFELILGKSCPEESPPRIHIRVDGK